MRILLAHNSTYFPGHGGGDKSNRLLMEALASRGHEVLVATRVEQFGPEARDTLLRQLVARGVEARADGSVVAYSLHGVDVRVLAADPNLRPFFSERIDSFDPEIILTSTDDPGQLLFDVAVRAAKARVVHLVRATIAVPFGPDASAPNPAKTRSLARADAIVGVSEYVAGYVREHGGLDAVHVPISLLDAVNEYPLLGRFDNPYVMMFNPCAVKGIDIFLAVADRMPDVRFAAVPTWGTTAEDRAALERRPNITVLSPVDDVDVRLRDARVLLVPSVWAEARSRAVPEAMSRGVPVVASDAGGIKEAKLGVEYLLPVNLIRHYRPSLDRNLVPVAEVPPQNVEPWVATVRRLVSDREHWEDVSRRSREAAIAYAGSINVAPFESLLQAVRRRPKKEPPPEPLTEDKKRLLAARLKQKAKPAATPLLTGLGDNASGTRKLFCFPYAGGGATLYRSWRDPLAETAAVIIARVPAAETLQQAAAALANEIGPHVGEGDAFFGHSMGAALAFEAARRLATPPSVLIASAARAPVFRFRHNPGPDPDDAEFLDELRRLGGMPREILDNPQLLKIALPALRSDTRLYRRYIYEPGEPLHCTVCAYGGEDDPNVRPEHLERWREHTRGAFARREFGGGHFYIQTDPAFLPTLAADLKNAAAPPSPTAPEPAPAE